MARIPGIRRLFRLDRGTRDVRGAVDDELRFHFDMTVNELVAAGIPPDAARLEAERRFGNVIDAKERMMKIDRERVGRQRRTEWGSAILQDLRYAIRGLRANPGFLAAVVVTLGVGIGADVAMFGVIDRLLFRPPAFLAHPDRDHLVVINRIVQNKPFDQSYFQYTRYADIARGTTAAFDRVGGFFFSHQAVGVGADAHEVLIEGMSASYLEFFRVTPELGRFFSRSDDVAPDGTDVVVLSDAFWRTTYGADTTVVGKTMQLGAHLFTIVGVAPEGFAGGLATVPAVFVPLTAYAHSLLAGGSTDTYDKDYHMSWVQIVAERKPGVSIAAATAILDQAVIASFRAQQAQDPNTAPINVMKPRGIITPILVERGPNRSNDTKVALWVAGVAVIVLLVACANVANLLLARALRRQREVALRLALGVSRGRLAAQLLTETMLLASLAGGAGLVIAEFGGGILRRQFLPDGGPARHVAADARTLAFTGLVAVVVATLTGIAPLLHSLRTGLSDALKSGAREGTVQRGRLRTALLIAQGALSVVLLVGAGLFVRSLHAVNSADIGMTIDGVAVITPNMRGVVLDSARAVELRRSLAAAATAVPGVRMVARTELIPFYSERDEDITVPGLDTAKINAFGTFDMQVVSPEYFATMGIGVIQGRPLLASDVAGAEPVMVVSDAMARDLWPGQNALGKCVNVVHVCRTVVGVARTASMYDLTGDPGLDYYLPIDQLEPSRGDILVKAASVRDFDRIIEPLRRALQSVMPGASYVTVVPLSSFVDSERKSWNLGATMFTMFGGLALLLAAVGLYSSISYSVAQRRHEMGIRLALGADANNLVWLVMRSALAVAAAGIALGWLTALAASRWLGPLLFKESPRDPAVFGSVMVAMLLVAAAAAAIPARRATRVDPATALRSD